MTELIQSKILLKTILSMILVILVYGVFKFSQIKFESNYSLEKEKVFQLQTKLKQQISQNQIIHSKFLQFIAENNKNYNKIENDFQYDQTKEYYNRFKIFIENFQYIQEINSKNLSYKLGINIFSDLTEEEFLDIHSNKAISQQNLEDFNQNNKRFLGLDYSDQASKNELLKLKSIQGRFKLQRYEEILEQVNEQGMDIGDYEYIDKKLIHCPIVNWIESGAVLKELKNQRKCGSCWAHSAAAAVENLYARYNSINDQNEVPSFSEQQLIDCNTFPNLGCFGGKAIFAFNYSKNIGLTESKYYPYTDQTGECKMNDDKQQIPIKFKIDNFKVYNHLLQHDLEKLVCEGVVAVPMRINKCIKHYISGIIDDRDGLCSCSIIGGPNHAVAIVGFGEDYSSFESQQISNSTWTSSDGDQNTICRKYWILRNSWTDRWGEGGYFRICRDDDTIFRDGTCFIRQQAILPIMNKKYSR